MKALQIDEQSALRLYPTASVEFKKMLEENFGKEFFERKITDTIKTYKDACLLLNLQPRTIEFYSAQTSDPNSDARAVGEFAFHQLSVIAEALNEGWVADWSDSSQRKYFPWFEYKKQQSGFGFSHSGFDFAGSAACVGSRLSFRTSELAEYAGKTFIEIYNHLLKK